jgi:hypothetical protein
VNALVTLRDPDAEYFQAIEEFFVSRRGDPLFLSNADWLLIRHWREQGLPLRVVQRGISDAMDSHDLSWSRHKKVGSLRYCAAEVETAADRWRRALAGGQDEAALSGALATVVAALRTSATLGPQARRAADAIADELTARVESNGAPEALEAWLREAEARLLAGIDEDAPEAVRRALVDEVERDLLPYGDRLPAKVLAQVRAESHARRRLEQHGIPRLSLWTL